MTKKEAWSITNSTGRTVAIALSRETALRVVAELVSEAETSHEPWNDRAYGIYRHDLYLSAEEA